MFKKITRKYLRHIKYYSKLVFEKLPIMMEHPYYYLIEWLKICKSLISTILRELPDIKINLINRKIHGVNFRFYFDFAPRYRSVFFEFNSINVIRVLLKFIKKGSCFIDAGANIGYISAVGAGLVGKKGEVHSFEPVSLYFKKLDELRRINKNYKIYVNNFALGESKGRSYINLNKRLIGGSSMVPSLLDSDNIIDTVEIEVKRLDDYIAEKKIENISLIKIDVEGFELPLLKGLSRFFDANKDSLPPLIIEVAPNAYPLLGYKLKDLDELMRKYNYQAYNFNEKIKIDLKKLNKTTDVLFQQKI